MNLSDYVQYDATGLAQLIKSRQVSSQEVQQSATRAFTTKIEQVCQVDALAPGKPGERSKAQKIDQGA